MESLRAQFNQLNGGRKRGKDGENEGGGRTTRRGGGRGRLIEEEGKCRTGGGVGATSWMDVTPGLQGTAATAPTWFMTPLTPWWEPHPGLPVRVTSNINMLESCTLCANLSLETEVMNVCFCVPPGQKWWMDMIALCAIRFVPLGDLCRPTEIITSVTCTLITLPKVWSQQNPICDRWDTCVKPGRSYSPSSGKLLKPDIKCISIETEDFLVQYNHLFCSVPYFSCDFSTFEARL